MDVQLAVHAISTGQVLVEMSIGAIAGISVYIWYNVKKRMGNGGSFR